MGCYHFNDMRCQTLSLVKMEVVEDFARKHIKAEVARLLSEERKKCGLSMNVLAAKAG